MHATPIEPGAMDPLRTPVFILGLHRSGTTLLYEMMAATGCWNAVWAWHVIEFDRLRSAPPGTAESPSDLGRRFERSGLRTRGVDVVRVTPSSKEEYGFILDNHGYGSRITRADYPFFRHACGVIQNTHPHARPLLLKNPWDFGNARLIKELIPSARFVWIHRNPLHVLSSQSRFAARAIFESIPYVEMLSRRYARFRRGKWRLAAARLAVTHGTKPLTRALIRYAATRCNGYLKDASLIPASERVEVRYEDLCRTPRETLRRVMARLDLPLREIDYAAMIGPRASRVEASVAHQKPLIRRLMGDYLSQVGLDPD